MLIDPTTAAKDVSVRMRAGSTLQVRGTLGSDVIDVNIPDGAGGWKSLTEDGTVVQLTEDNEQLAALGHTLVQVDKPSTSNSVGVAIIG